MARDLFNRLTSLYQELHAELGPLHNRSSTPALDEKVKALSAAIFQNKEIIEDDLSDYNYKDLFKNIKTDLQELNISSGTSLIEEIEQLQQVLVSRILTRLKALYQEFHDHVVVSRDRWSFRGGTTLDYKVNALISYIRINESVFAFDLSNQAELYNAIKTDLKAVAFNIQLISTIEWIQHKKIASEPKLLVDWLNKQSNGVEVKVSDLKSDPGKILKAFEVVKQMRRSEPFQYGFESALSRMVVSSLDLEFKSFDQVRSLFSDPETQAMALGHLMNFRKTSLKDLRVSVTELKRLAPYLLNVDCRGVAFKDDNEAQDFVKSCSNVYTLQINSDKITELKQLPVTLTSLYCNGCTALKALAFSNLPLLQTFGCNDCKALEELTLSNLPSLQFIYASQCSALRDLSLSNLPLLQSLSCPSCTALRDLALSNFPELNNFYFADCTALRTLTLSNLPLLQELSSSHNSALRELALFNLTGLKKLYCVGCRSLETIVSNGLPSCDRVDHSNCPHLRQLPQLPPGATVISHGSIGFNSFEVAPDDLKLKPLTVLCNLGEAIMRDKRMPNIVYLNSPGLDAGGLRRQLVTTLLKNLFQEEASPLSRTKPDDGVFPLLENFDETKAKAFKTLGALIALSSLGSLPLGRFLQSGFYFVVRSMTEELASMDPTKPLDEEFAKKIYKLGFYGDPNFVLEEDVQPIALPIILAAQGFREIMRDEDLKKVRQLPISEFVNKIAGEEITWAHFKKLVAYKNDRDQKTENYFKTFFGKYEKNPEKLEDMIELFTASRALGREEIKIFVDDKLNKKSLFSVVTCFQQVTMPSYDTYEEFESKLFKSIDYTQGEFDKA